MKILQLVDPPSEFDTWETWESWRKEIDTLAEGRSDSDADQGSGRDDREKDESSKFNLMRAQVNAAEDAILVSFASAGA